MRSSVKTEEHRRGGMRMNNSAIGAIMIDPMIGVWVDKYGISKTYFIMGIVLVLLFIAWVSKTKRDSRFV